MEKRRPEYWKAPAILWFLKENARNEPEELIKLKANELIFRSKQNRPPINLEKIYKLRNIISFEFGDISSLSQLLPVSNGFKMIVNQHSFQYAHKTHRRLRFSIAHEIGHTYFYDFESKIPKRPNRDSGSRAEERLCDIFAAELLMPESIIKSDCAISYKKLNNWCETLIDLEEKYKVSMQALAGRLIELNIINNVVVIKWRIKVRTSTGTKEKLRVDWSLPRKSGKLRYVWDDDSAPLKSVFYTALNEDKVIQGKYPIKFGYLNGIFSIEARRYNTESKSIKKEPNQVLSLLWLK